MRDPIMSAAEWGTQHPKPYRAISATIIAISFALQVRAAMDGDLVPWVRVALAVLAVATLVALGVLANNWYRHDALEDVKEHIVERTGESMLGDYAWLILYGTATTRELWEIRRWLPHHDITTSPSEDMPARLVEAVREMIEGAPGFFDRHE